jgi:hypothetical protein
MAERKCGACGYVADVHRAPAPCPHCGEPGFTTETELDDDARLFQCYCREGALLQRCFDRNLSAGQRIVERYEPGDRLYPFADSAPARTIRVSSCQNGEYRKTYGTSLLDGPTTSDLVTDDGKRLWAINVHFNNIYKRREALRERLVALLHRYGLTL